MKAFIVLCSVISIVYCKTLGAHSGFHKYGGEQQHVCINMWDEGCNNGQLGGAGNDDDYLNGGFNPGKRCVNIWDDGCINGQLGGSAGVEQQLVCLNAWDDGCINGPILGAGNDHDYVNGVFTPGKRSLQSLLEKLKEMNHHQ